MGASVNQGTGPTVLCHLRTAPQFQAVMNAGVVATSAHFALHRLSLATEDSLFQAAPGWIGAVLPKRHAKKAVRRNLLRRQIYAVASGLPTRLIGAAHVVRLRRDFESEGFVSASSAPLKKAVGEELQALFSKASASIQVAPL